jgi:hypothetical protein
MSPEDAIRITVQPEDLEISLQRVHDPDVAYLLACIHRKLLAAVEPRCRGREHLADPVWSQLERRDVRHLWHPLVSRLLRRGAARLVGLGLLRYEALPPRLAHDLAEGRPEPRALDSWRSRRSRGLSSRDLRGATDRSTPISPRNDVVAAWPRACEKRLT